MTMLEERTDLSAVNLDDEPECSDAGWLGEEDTVCPNPARWQYSGTCGHPWLVCDEHHDELVNLSWHGGARCTCGDRTPASRLKWRHL